MIDAKNSGDDSAEEPGGEETISEVFTLQGRPVKNEEVADFEIRTVRLPGGGTRRDYSELTPEREATEDDFLGVRDPEEWQPTPESLARTFDGRVIRNIRLLSYLSEDRESSLSGLKKLSGEFSELAPEYQTESRRQRLVELAWLVEQQPYETAEEELEALGQHVQEVSALRNQRRHEEANALVREWSRPLKVLWPGLTRDEARARFERDIARLEEAGLHVQVEALEEQWKAIDRETRWSDQK